MVAFGGGHGLAASLSALRRVTDQLTAIVTVADDGGSSGRLRDELNCLPPGDLRMALAALCGDDESGRTWADVLQYRFDSDGPLGDHAIGNLLIAGLWERLGDPVAGLDMVARLLGAEGRVLPMASVPLEIEADVIGVDPDKPDEISVVRGQARGGQDARRGVRGPARPHRPAGLPGVGRGGAGRGLDRARSRIVVHLGHPAPAGAAAGRRHPRHRGPADPGPEPRAGRTRPPASPPPSTSSCWPSTRPTCGWTWCWPTAASPRTIRTCRPGPTRSVPAWWWPTWPPGTARRGTTRSGWRPRTPR